MVEPMTSTAVLSHDGDHRYELRRVWEAGLPPLVVCMFNPSTADAERNDPTILALIAFAKLWGYGGLLVINLYSIRTSSPKVAMNHPYRQGQANKHWQNLAIKVALDQGTPMLVAWGNSAGPSDFGTTVFEFLERAEGVKLVCLGITQAGAPKHPMARGKHRIPRTQGPIAWPQ